MPRLAKNSVAIEKPFGGWARVPEGQGTITLAASIEGAENQYGESTICSLFRFEHFVDIAPGEIFQDVAGGSAFVNALPIDADRLPEPRQHIRC